MTDIEKLKALLQEFGVPYDEKTYDDSSAPAEHYVNVREGAADTVDGYCMFFTAFVFSAEGKFIRMGAWE